jgi:hypothetical protein
VSELNAVGVVDDAQQQCAGPFHVGYVFTGEGCLLFEDIFDGQLTRPFGEPADFFQLEQFGLDP